MSGALFLSGCARLFGWDIHAPGLLSEGFAGAVPPAHERVALYLPPEVLKFESRARGSRWADPQTYHVGEAYGPMLVEAFQQAFDEFILMETEPRAPMLKRYGILFLVTVRIKNFRNRVTLRGQVLELVTEAAVLDQDLRLLARFDATGTSDTRKVFAKKGGPEVNLNAALEANILALVQYLQDSLRQGVRTGAKNP
jgi:hypothetical protein